MQKATDVHHAEKRNLLGIVLIENPPGVEGSSSISDSRVDMTNREVTWFIATGKHLNKANTIQLQKDAVNQDLFFPLEKVDSPWLLLLKSDEILTKHDIKILLKILRKKSNGIIQLPVSNRLSEDAINHFGWVLSSDVFKRPKKEIATYHTMEPRLFHRESLTDEIVKLKKNGPMRWFFYPDNFKDINSDKNVSVAIETSHPHFSKITKPKDVDIFRNGHLKYFRDLHFCERFVWPPAIYLLIRHEHIPGIIRALEKGLSSPKAAFFALRFLILNGAFDLAAKMIPLIPQRWEKNEPMLPQFIGMVHYFKGDIEKAVNAYERSLALYHESENMEALVNVAKLYLISGYKDKSLQLFCNCLKIADQPSARKTLSQFVENIQTADDEEIRLSLCMIVRDEEKYIDQALSSIAGCVDEIVVVDTGSMDETKKTAMKYNASVYDFEWTNDFSAARNFALEKSSGDYIFVMDADERLSSFHRLNFLFLKKLLSKQKAVAYRFSIGRNNIETSWMNINQSADNFIPEKTDVRLFPNNGSIKYQFRVEETLEKSLAEKSVPVAVIQPKDCQLMHANDNREWRLKRKNIAFELETDRNCSFISSAVRHFFTLGEEEQTIAWLRSLNIRYDQVDDIWPSRLLLAQLLEKNDRKTAETLYFDLVRRHYDIPKVFIASISYFLRNKQFDRIPQIAFKDHASDNSGQFSIEMMFYQTYGALCLLENECQEKGVQKLEDVLKKDRYFIPAQIVRYYFLSKWSDPSNAIIVFEDICHLLNTDNDWKQNVSAMSFMDVAEKISDVLSEKGYIPERAVFLEGSLNLIKQLVNK